MGNPSKLAVILTGAPRALRETIDHIEMSLSQCDFHLFVALDTDDSKYHELFRDRFAQQLVFYQEVRKADYESSIRDIVDARIPDGCQIHCPVFWPSHYVKGYLTNSGSLIEYKQIEIAVTAMMEQDRLSGNIYTSMVRIRADHIGTELIRDLTLISDKEIDDLRERVQCINTGLGSYNMALHASSLVHPVRSFMRDFSTVPHDKILCDEDEPKIHQPRPADSLSWYLRDGSFVIAFHVNTSFYAGRKAFSAIRDIYTNFAKRDFLSSDPDWVRRCPNWWDSEHQLYFACIDNDLLYTNTYLPTEYNYNGPVPEAFNEDFTKLLPNNPNACFFFWRHCVPP